MITYSMFSYSGVQIVVHDDKDLMLKLEEIVMLILKTQQQQQQHSHGVGGKGVCEREVGHLTFALFDL